MGKLEEECLDVFVLGCEVRKILGGILRKVAQSGRKRCVKLMSSDLVIWINPEFAVLQVKEAGRVLWSLLVRNDLCVVDVTKSFRTTATKICMTMSAPDEGVTDEIFAIVFREPAKEVLSGRTEVVGWNGREILSPPIDESVAIEGWGRVWQRMNLTRSSGGSESSEEGAAVADATLEARTTRCERRSSGLASEWVNH